MPWINGTWVAHEVLAGNASTFTEMIQYANTVSDDIFGIMLLTSIFFVIFIASSKRDSGGGLAASLFITAILSYILAAMDVVGDWVAWVMTFALVGAIVLLYKGGSSDV